MTVLLRRLAILWLIAAPAWAQAGDEKARRADLARAELGAIAAGTLGGGPALSGLQVAVVRAGDTVFGHATGMARLGGGDARPLTPQHKMRVASISKLTTAIGLMTLVEAGTVKLDADVSGYLGFSLRNPHHLTTPITLRMLLSHISSLRDAGGYWLPAGSGTFPELFYGPGGAAVPGRFAEGEERGPGTYFEYANLNYGVVAAVVETVTGARFDRFMRAAVLAPLHLSASYNVCDLVAAQAPLATLFRKGDTEGNWRPHGPWRPQVDEDSLACANGMVPVAASLITQDRLAAYRPGDNPTLFSPHGGLRASAGDLARVARLLLAGGTLEGAAILTPATVAAMRAPVWSYDPARGNGRTQEAETDPDGALAGLMTSYGLSLHRIDLRDWGLSEAPRPLLGHLGNAYGLLGQLWIDFENDAALVALITGTADRPRPAAVPVPLYGAEAALLRWWLRHFPPAPL